jgi:aspartate/methionine/tyrosine aminotransferase
MTAFPLLLSGEDSRPFCEALVEKGVLLAPGDCFGMPSHFRLGFGAASDRFSTGLERFCQFLKSWTPEQKMALR